MPRRRLLLSLCLAILGLTLVWAAAALIDQVAAGSGAGGDVTTGAIDSTGGNLALIGLSDYAPSGTDSVTDSKPNVYALCGVTSGAAAGRSAIYHKYAPTVGAGHTFSTNNGGTFYPALYGVVFSGIASSPCDQTSGATGSGTTLATGSITPSAAALVVSCLTFDATATASIDSGMTLLPGQINYGAGTHFGIACAYKSGVTGAINPTWTVSASATLQTRIAAFLESASGGTPLHRLLLTQGVG